MKDTKQNHQTYDLNKVSILLFFSISPHIPFASSPQFMIKLEDPDDDGEEDDCTIIVALMQKNRRKAKRRGQESLTIGYAIYKVNMCAYLKTKDNKINSVFPSLFFVKLMQVSVSLYSLCYYIQNLLPPLACW